MEFFGWSMLATYSGATFGVAILTQITKDIPFIKKLPTQVWSYILSLFVLICAQAFTEGLSADGIGLAVINAAMVSLASNGGYDAVERLRIGLNTTNE